MVLWTKKRNKKGASIVWTSQSKHRCPTKSNCQGSRIADRYFDIHVAFCAPPLLRHSSMINLSPTGFGLGRAKYAGFFDAVFEMALAGFRVNLGGRCSSGLFRGWVFFLRGCSSYGFFFCFVVGFLYFWFLGIVLRVAILLLVPVLCCWFFPVRFLWGYYCFTCSCSLLLLGCFGSIFVGLLLLYYWCPVGSSFGFLWSYSFFSFFFFFFFIILSFFSLHNYEVASLLVLGLDYSSSFLLISSLYIPLLPFHNFLFLSLLFFFLIGFFSLDFSRVVPSSPSPCFSPSPPYFSTSSLHVFLVSSRSSFS